jgi:hypothetical protein
MIVYICFIQYVFGCDAYYRIYRVILNYCRGFRGFTIILYKEFESTSQLSAGACISKFCGFV